jgi:predicted transcriptional regulator YdeE
MKIEIVDQPIRFQLHGLSSSVENNSYGKVGCQLMDEMWAIVKQAKLKTGGINHWVYLAGDRMFVGIEVKDGGCTAIPKQLKPCDIELPRYAKHVHIGPYQELPQKWQSLKAELCNRGERVIMPSLEVYGHHCEGVDPETTILLGLQEKPK